MSAYDPDPHQAAKGRIQLTILYIVVAILGAIVAVCRALAG